MNLPQSQLYRDVVSPEERAMVLWKMANAIYLCHAENCGISNPLFGALPIPEREMWIRCARAALRAFMGFDGPEAPAPIAGLEHQ